MYLAGILGLCALLHLPASGGVRGDASFPDASSGYLVYQNPAQPQESQNPPASEPPSSEPKSDKAQPGPQDQSTPEKSSAGTSEAAKTNPEEKKPAPGVAPKKSPKKKSHPAQSPSGEPHKRVVHRGGTVEPTTQLAPGLTEEQAAKQRQTTNQLMASTDAALQKLSGRQLTKEEQDTVVQIRGFMKQVKAADAAGDLPRAYKLAVKARLLSDALAKP